MAVHVGELLVVYGIAPGVARVATGLSPDAWGRRMRGEVAWGRDELERLLNFLHAHGARLLALTFDDLVDPGTPLRPAGEKRLRLT